MLQHLHPVSSLDMKICIARTAFDYHAHLLHGFSRPSRPCTASGTLYICRCRVGLNNSWMVLYPLLQVDHVSHVIIQWVMASVSNGTRYTSMTLCMVKFSMLGFYISIRCVVASISQ